MINDEKKIAMLIDGDNADAKYIEYVIEEVSKSGRIIIKRIYGDFSDSHMKQWKDKLSTYVIKPVQKFAHVKGKNSTDIALVIDAMDILHKENVDIFCIVSSDSDFTTLAMRIKESGLYVIGIGKSHTPKPFINACDQFRNPEDFSSIAKEKTNKEIDIQLIRRAYSMVEQEDGQALLSRVVEAIQKIAPNFDPRTYGFKNNHQLFKSLDKDFEVIYHDDNKTISIKDKKGNTETPPE